jgi:hypothetical protein
VLASRPTRLLPLFAAATLLALAGCSSLTSAEAGMDAAGTTVGQTAIGQSSTSPGAAPSATTAPAWHDTTGCPAGVETGLREGLNQSKLNIAVTLTKIDPATVSGPTALPDLNQGIVASCAFRISSATASKTVEVFVSMPQSALASFEEKLTAAGFTTTSTPGTAAVLYSNGTSVVALQYVSNPVLSVVSVTG